MDFLSWAWRGTEDSDPLQGDWAGMPGFTRRILLSRGYRSLEAAEAFLDCRYSLHDPMMMADMAPAVKRIRQALGQGERILVFGDYDCDGVTATAMVYDYLESSGADVLYYIPEREGEGYGLNRAAANRIQAAGVSLVITVDNGISAIEEAGYFHSLGIDLIITDHHQPKDRLPEAVAVLDPHRPDCPYPYKELCGAGVAFKLICALEGEDPEMLLEQYGDILAIGTLADVVPLTEENRLLARRGLHILAATQRPGLLALAEAAGLRLEEENAEAVTFGIAPRINVAGRMGSVDSALELLLCQDEERAEELARELCALNNRRKEMEGEILQEIAGMVEERPQLVSQRIIILAGEHWHCGVIGIIASRLVDRWRKPCIILSRMEGECRGSARSVEGFSIIDAVAGCSGLLNKYGGHPMAAGFSMDPAREEAFCSAMEAFAMEHFPSMPSYPLTVDGALRLEDVTMESIAAINRLAPFGCGNPKPVLALLGVQLESVTPIGGGKHLRLGLSQDGVQAQAVLFGVTEKSFPFSRGEKVNCAVSLSVHEYNGICRPSIRVVGMLPAEKDLAPNHVWRETYDRIRRGEPLPPNGPVPRFGREPLSVVYRYLRGNSPCALGRDGLWHRLGGAADYFQVLASVDILKELKLLTETREDGTAVLAVAPVEKKMDLNDSPTYRRIMKLEVGVLNGRTVC